MPYEPPPNDEESKAYYDKSEKALRSMPKYEGNPQQNDAQYQPGGNNNGDNCWDKLLSFLFLAIAMTSYFA